MTQLTLVDDSLTADDRAVGLTDGPDRILTSAEAGLAAHIPDGPARLLAALVKRGLPEEHLEDAALLILFWNDHAPVDPDYRLCACNCGREIQGRRAAVKYVDDACRTRALRARRASTRPQPQGEPVVTVPRPPSASDGMPDQIGLAA